MSTEIITPNDQEHFWLVVEECLVEFHHQQRSASHRQLSALAETVASQSVERVELFYHAEPFDIACQLAETPLDVADYLERYLQIRDQQVPQPAYVRFVGWHCTNSPYWLPLPRLRPGEIHMAQPKCRRRSLSFGQRLLEDYLHFSSGVPHAGAERLMRLADIVAARQQASPRPSWAAIMTKAFARAASRHPKFRSAYLNFPWGHVGEFEYQIGSVILPRRIDDEDVLLLAPLVRPEDQSLADLDALLRGFKDDPIESISHFRSYLRFARQPTFLRRLLTWLALHVLPRRRARHFGTFGVTTMSPYGAKTTDVPTMWTALLHYGTIEPSGDVPVGIIFDHRVLDGALVGYVLLEMEQVLHHEIRAELQAMRPAQAA